MAQEATLVYETEIPIPFTCSNTTGIEKGTVLKMSDPMTAAIATAAGDIIAGIAATEKIANDGKTKVSVYRRGIFKMYLSGACTVGDALQTDDNGVNYVKRVSVSVSGSRVIGYALETGATGETILVDVNVCSGGVA